jgi:exosortase
MTSSAAQPPRLAEPPLPVVLGMLALLGLLGLAVFYDFLRQQVAFAVSQPSDWGHTLVIPAVGAYFVWLRRDELTAEPFRPFWPALVLLLLGVAWYALCVIGPKPLFHHNLQAAGVTVALVGAAWTILGTRAMRVLWFPLLYVCVFSQTLSERMLSKVTFLLQDLAALGAYGLLLVLGLDADRSGNTITVISEGVSHPLNVAEACSGMRMVVAFTALGTFLAYTQMRGLLQRTLMVLSAIPVAVAVNILRIVTLGVLSLADANFASGEFHHFVGLVWMLPGLLLFLGVQWVINNVMVEDRGAKRAV